MNLDGKVAFITGGGIAEAFAEQGMMLVIADINLAEAEAQVDRLGGGAITVGMDVTSLKSWQLAREAALAAFGQVDVLCNNAGISAPGTC